MTSPAVTDPADIVWGTRGIAAVIGLTPRQTSYRLQIGDIPARRVGSRWSASRSKLLAYLAGNDPAKVG